MASKPAQKVIFCPVLIKFTNFLQRFEKNKA